MKSYSFGHGKASFYPPSGYMIHLWDQPGWLGPAEWITCKIGDVVMFFFGFLPEVKKDNGWYDRFQFAIWNVEQRLHLWPDKHYKNYKTVYLTEEQAKAVVDNDFQDLIDDIESSTEA